MADRKQIWRVIVSALLIVLVLALTVGTVFHHHDQCSANSCVLCHLAIAPPGAMIGATGLVAARAEHAVGEQGFVSRCRANKIQPRAPPA